MYDKPEWTAQWLFRSIGGNLQTERAEVPPHKGKTISSPGIGMFTDDNISSNIFPV